MCGQVVGVTREEQACFHQPCMQLACSLWTKLTAAQAKPGCVPEDEYCLKGSPKGQLCLGQQNEVGCQALAVQAWNHCEDLHTFNGADVLALSSWTGYENSYAARAVGLVLCMASLCKKEDCFKLKHVPPMVLASSAMTYCFQKPEQLKRW